MKTKVKSLALITLTLLILAISVTACGSKAGNTAAGAEETEGVKVTKEDLYGTWRGIGTESGTTLSFSKDGNCRDQNGDLVVAGPYSVNEDAQTLTVTDTEIGMSFTYSMSMSENGQLTIQVNGGRPRNFAKQQ